MDIDFSDGVETVVSYHQESGPFSASQAAQNEKKTDHYRSILRNRRHGKVDPLIFLP
jgi:hypothetical protein